MNATTGPGESSVDEAADGDFGFGFSFGFSGRIRGRGIDGGFNRDGCTFGRGSRGGFNVLGTEDGLRSLICDSTCFNTLCVESWCDIFSELV